MHYCCLLKNGPIKICFKLHRKLNRQKTCQNFWDGVLVIISAGLLFFIALSFFLGKKTDTVLEFRLQDSVTGSWVWDAEIIFQGKIINAFYQIETGKKIYRFTNLEKGNWELVVKAPSCRTEIINVSIKNGINKLDNPVIMTGLEIPGLDRFIVVENKSGNKITSELRPVDVKDNVIINHPSLNIAVLALISEQLDQEPYRGKRLFYGTVPWLWNTQIDKAYRYELELPYSVFKELNTKFLIIDYLVIVPDPVNMTKQELDLFLQKAGGYTRVEDVIEFLELNKDKLKYYITTSKNISGVLP